MEGYKLCTNSWCEAVIAMIRHGPVELRLEGDVTIIQWKDTLRGDTFTGTGPTVLEALEQLLSRARGQ